MKKFGKVILLICTAMLLIVSCGGGGGGGGGAAGGTASPTVQDPSVLPQLTITLGYRVNPSTQRIYCNELLEPGYTCNIYRYAELGSGTMVTIAGADSTTSVYYTLDGTEPTNQSTQYTQPFEITKACTIKAKAYKNNESGDVKVLSVTNPYGRTPTNNIGGFFIAGSGYSGICIVYEALSDNSGPDFSKQHYFLKLDHGCCDNTPAMANGVVVTFDSFTEANAVQKLGNLPSHNTGDTFVSTGSWSGTLWTREFYKIESMSDNYGVCICTHN